MKKRRDIKIVPREISPPTRRILDRKGRAPNIRPWLAASQRYRSFSRIRLAE